MNFDLTKKYNIQVCNVDQDTTTMVEFGLGLLLAHIKQIVPADKIFRQGKWESRDITKNTLINKNILILGSGAIAQEFAKLLSIFTKNIVALSKSKKKNFFFKKVIGWEEYENEAGQADYVINTLPLTKETTGIINNTKIRQIKKGAHFMNVGRGATVDDEALYYALKDSAHLDGACLDVWWLYNWTREYPEPFYPSKFPYHELPNVTLSPHRMVIANDLGVDYWSKLIENIVAIEKGTELKNKIDPEKGYN